MNSYWAHTHSHTQGYGKETDLWSVGVIMFLLLCGKLPFDGDDHDEIIRNTIQVWLFICLFVCLLYLSYLLTWPL